MGKWSRASVISAVPRVEWVLIVYGGIYLVMLN